MLHALSKNNIVHKYHPLAKNGAEFSEYVTLGTVRMCGSWLYDTQDWLPVRHYNFIPV